MRRRFSIVIRLAPLALLSAAALGAPTLTAAGGGCHGDNGSVYTEGSATVVRMDVCDFAPTVSRVPVGAEVRFLNTDQVPHIVIGRRLTWASAELRRAPSTCSASMRRHLPVHVLVPPGDGRRDRRGCAPGVGPRWSRAWSRPRRGDADDGPAVALLIGAGALMLGAGLGMGLVLGRRRTAATSD